MSPEKRVDHITTDTVGHSGNLPPEKGQELPVREFDNTPLEQAHREGLLITPESTADIVPVGDEPTDETTDTLDQDPSDATQTNTSQEEQVRYYGFEPVIDQPVPSKEKKKRNKLIVAVGGVAAAAAAATALFLLPKGDDTKPSTNAPAPTTPVATAQATPGASEVSKQGSGELGTFTVDAMKIPAGLSDEEFGRTLVDRLNTWYTAGATKENQDRWWASKSPETVVDSIASDNTFTGAKALFGPDWQKDGAIAEQVSGIESVNKSFDLMWYMSYEQKMAVGPVIQENVEYSSVEVSSSTNAGRTLNVLGVIHNNADKSNLGKTFPKISTSNGKAFRANVTTKVDPATNTEYIVNYTLY